MNVVELKGISKSYGPRRSKLDVLHVADLRVPEGDFLVIEGPSGCGKSTLLNIVGLLDRPDEGVLRIDGEDMTDAGEAARCAVRNRKIGFVFQQFNLLPDLTAAQNVALPLVAAGVPRAERMRRARELLARVGLAKRESHHPNRMSGGEQQRVAVARALVTRPRLLLADEPTGNLDRAATDAVMELFREMHKEVGATVMLVTHDPAVAAKGARVLRSPLRK